MEILLQIPGRYAVIGAHQKRLEVADGNMHPGQPRLPCQVGLPVRHGGESRRSPPGRPVHRGAPVTEWEMTLNKLRHRFAGDGIDLLHGDKPGKLVHEAR